MRQMRATFMQRALAKIKCEDTTTCEELWSSLHGHAAAGAEGFCEETPDDQRQVRACVATERARKTLHGGFVFSNVTCRNISMNVVETSNRWKDCFRCLQFRNHGDRVGAASITSSFDASPSQGTRTFCASTYTWLSSLWGGFSDHP